MPKKKFKNLSKKKQKEICKCKIGYWIQMRKALRRAELAITDEEKVAILVEADMDLVNDPPTEEEE